MHPAQHVQVTMQLRLHSVVPEVRHEPEAAGGLLLRDLDGETRSAREQRRLPPLRLAHVRSRRSEVHHRRPGEGVAEHDDLIVLVADLAGKRACCDAAERAILHRRSVSICHPAGAPSADAPSAGSPAR